ncbi:hypothetical protein TRICI_002554 [Trichomonascus ciferrii]|uniref:Amino acid transporter transmembrane domain-containing protein n=1 Tax=Trichomonascus ciferrii TaxID=44093 RepID=A0A642V646_9ASCO|nr:hypothetical protein TRICI_002554 [Trichomonascus ciferrii]
MSKQEINGPLKGALDDSTSIESQPQAGTLEQYLMEEIAAEADNEIKYRTCSWQKTAALLFCEYICLAMMSFPNSYSVLGLVPGLILTVFVSLTMFYTGLVLWEYCLRNPRVRDMCDIGQKLLGDKRWGWYFTATMFMLNNTFVCGVHVFTGRNYLETVAPGKVCGVVYGIVVAIVCFLFSLPRTFASMSWPALFSAGTMGLSVVLAMIFSGVQDAPANYDPAIPVKYNLFPAPGTTFVQGMNAFLNIAFTFAGQVTYPSFIAEMRNPREFKKSLACVTVAELVLFSLTGAIIYVYVGNEYMTAPAFGSLQIKYDKIAFSFTVPAIIFLGVLYAAVAARFIFFRIFRDNRRHLTSNTKTGWLVWGGILLSTWLIAFVIAEGIPIFNDLLSLLCSLFSCWFGFIFWGIAYFTMRYEDYGAGWYLRLRSPKAIILFALNVFIIACGLVIMGPGTYATVQSIINAFNEGTVGGAFSCQ